MSLTPRDNLQVNAFKAIHKGMRGTPEDRFARAIAATSDDVFARLLQQRPDLVGEYQRDVTALRAQAREAKHGN